MTRTWAVDTVSNEVVIWTDPGSRAPAAAFIRDSGVVPAMVRVETAAGDLNVLEPAYQPRYRFFADFEYDFYRSLTD